MKILNKVVIGMATLVLLTACGPSKCDYAKFHSEAVKAAEKDAGYKKVTVKGKLASLLGTLEIDAVLEKKDGEWDLTKGDVASAVTLAGMIAATANTVAEDSEMTYYAGNGFKTVKGENVRTYNAAGFLTSAKLSDGTDLKASYSK